ncbi:hypothetical protein MRX96_046624 [Rhipicephalus microplus]
MSSYSLRPSSKQRNYREMAQIVDAVVKHRVARLRDRCKPPISEDIYDEILLLMEEKLESGKVASLLTVSEKARKYWRTHGREFVDLIDLQEHLGRPSKGILLKNGRALLSESLAEELVVQYVAQRGPQTVQRDMQSLFELPLPLIQAHVQRSTNVRLAKDRRYMRLKFEERMSELRQNVLAEGTAATAVSPEANGLPLNGQVGTAGGVAVTAPAPADLPVLLIKPMPKRKAKPKSHEQKMRDAVAAARPVVAAQVSPPHHVLGGAPRNLIPELCRQFYDLGWVTGTGGGISIRHGHEIYIAPSGVQKERIAAEDLFVQDMEERFLSGASAAQEAAQERMHAPLHERLHAARCGGSDSHSLQGSRAGNSALPGHRVSDHPSGNDQGHQESGTSRRACEKRWRRYPDTCAVLVRRHGVYVWGDSWQRAKTMCECYDYLFDIAVQMKRLGMDPMLPPEPQQNVAAATTLAEAVQVATTGETEAVSVDPPSTLTTLSGELADAPGFMLNLNGPVSTEGQTTYVVYT